MGKVSVNLESPSPYIEPESILYKIKRKLTYRFAINAIGRYQAKSNTFRLLEIGTGSGYFLAFIHAEFPAAVLHGIEYDPRLLHVTQSRAPYAHCINGNAESFDFGDEQFDVIVSFQVIEHLYSPAMMLASVRKHLKPNGIFIVTTPNLDGLGARMMGERWHGFREDHVSLKGYNQWKSLIEDSGFIVDYCGSTFFSGIPLLNSLPLGIFNWTLLTLFGAARWKHGESFVGVFQSRN
jgi:SAM-dependent methyltransferase